MKMRVAATAVMLMALPMLPSIGRAQSPQKGSTLTIAGHQGEAPLIKVNGKMYIDIETLARLTRGTLSFKANQTVLSLPPSEPEAPALAPATHATAGFSRAFTQAGIEEMSVIRDWRNVIVNAVLKNSPASEDWISTQQALADKGLELASASVSTSDDHSAYPLLSSEFNNMRALSEHYLAFRQQAAFISPDTFHSTPLEDQILNCARGFESMTESHEFQDQPACH